MSPLAARVVVLVLAVSTLAPGAEARSLERALDVALLDGEVCPAPAPPFEQGCGAELEDLAELERAVGEHCRQRPRRGCGPLLRDVRRLRDDVEASCAARCAEKLAALSRLDARLERRCARAEDARCGRARELLARVAAAEAERCATCDGGDCAWPNDVSRANGDAWLLDHHDRIERLSPTVLVLLYANPGTPEGMSALLDLVVEGFAVASHGQLQYRLHVVDLRDGADGRPPPPEGFPFENSTLFPRPADGLGQLDYAALFSVDYAEHLGFPDEGAPGQHLDLCTLVDRGLVHEVWLVGSGDVPDAAALEVASVMQRYDDDGRPIPDVFNRCANGCVDDSVPFCGRSLHIGFVNYNRGPGCFLHSKAHDVEFGVSANVPPLAEWFTPFARFDLTERYDLPFGSLYALSCDEPPCLEHRSPSDARFTFDGAVIEVAGFDPACGNAHFAPTGVEHFDYFNPGPVLSSCEGFGRHCGPGGSDELSLIGGSVEALPWNTVDNARYPDCGGELLVWWYQHMPARGSAQTFDDGRRMPSVWPFFFY